jgi:hypothetical protein
VIPRFTYQHKWRSGDIIVWDNRSAMHRATTSKSIRCDWNSGDNHPSLLPTEALVSISGQPLLYRSSDQTLKSSIRVQKSL